MWELVMPQVLQLRDLNRSPAENGHDRRHGRDKMVRQTCASGYNAVSVHSVAEHLHAHGHSQCRTCADPTFGDHHSPLREVRDIVPLPNFVRAAFVAVLVPVTVTNGAKLLLRGVGENDVPLAVVASSIASTISGSPGALSCDERLRWQQNGLTRWRLHTGVPRRSSGLRGN